MSSPSNASIIDDGRRDGRASNVLQQGGSSLCDTPMGVDDGCSAQSSSIAAESEVLNDGKDVIGVIRDRVRTVSTVPEPSSDSVQCCCCCTLDSVMTDAGMGNMSAWDDDTCVVVFMDNAPDEC